MKHEYLVESLDQTELTGVEIASKLGFPLCVYLNGEMGVGKTTLAKSILKGLGYEGEVTSPTYNLIQEYSVGRGTVYHMDLYRLEDPSELEFLAVSDLWSKDSIFIVEWPQKGRGFLPEPDAEIFLNIIDGPGSERRNIILNI